MDFSSLDNNVDENIHLMRALGYGDCNGDQNQQFEMNKS